LPIDAGNFDTSPTTSGYNGVWGVYPYFPSGKIIAGDMQNGLWVFRFTALAPRLPVSLLEPADGDTVAPGGPLTFRWSSPADPQADPHNFRFRIVGGEVDDTLDVQDTVAVFPATASLQPGQTYRWHVITRDEWNSTASPDTFSFVYDLPGGVGEGELPAGFALLQNFPNPFNGGTTIRYRLPAGGGSGRVTLAVFDLLGRQVATLVDAEQEAGEHRVRFDPSWLASGLYLYRIAAGPYVETRKMMLLR
jgi:hypothetical protein